MRRLMYGFISDIQNQITIPSVFISYADGIIVKSKAGSNATLTISSVGESTFRQRTYPIGNNFISVGHYTISFITVRLPLLLHSSCWPSPTLPSSSSASSSVVMTTTRNKPFFASHQVFTRKYSIHRTSRGWKSHAARHRLMQRIQQNVLSVWIPLERVKK